MLHETYKLSEKEIRVASLRKGDIDKINEFQNFINDLIREDAPIKLNRPISLSDERTWFSEQIKKIKRTESVYIFSSYNDRVIGCASVDLLKNRRAHVGELGIAVSKNYRGIGLGEKMMQVLIREVRKRFKRRIKMISLSVFATNLPAIKLYEKLNFKIFARIPRQFRYRGRFIDEIVMIRYL